MKKILLFILLVLSISILISKESDYLEQGIIHYQNGEFESALDYFLQYQQTGITNPDLLFNIGNAYFRLNNITQAIIHYKRVLLLDSSYKPAKENLKYAMSLTQDIQVNEDANFLSDFLTKIVYKFSINTIFYIILSLIILITLIIHLQWLDSSFKVARLFDKAVLRFVNYMLLLILIIFIGLGATRVSFVKNFNEAVINENTVNVYSGPADTFTRLFTMHQGTVIKVHKEENNWSQISTLSGYNGWIKSNSYQKIIE